MSFKDLKGGFYDISNLRFTNQKLGQGFFGSVYIIKDLKDQKDYALKIISTDEDFDEEILISQLEAYSKLNHPCVVSLIGLNFDSFRYPNKYEPSIITEYFPNGSLRTIFDKEKKSIPIDYWSPTKKYITLLGIAHTMEYLHKNKIITSNLKPENVLLDANFYPHISDCFLSSCLKDSFSKSVKLTMSG